MNPWFMFLQNLPLQALYFRDLTSCETEGVNWEAVTALDDPILLRIDRDKLSRVVESLVSQGAGPSLPAALLPDSPEKTTECIFGTLGNIELLGRKAGFESGYLLILEEIEKVKAAMEASMKLLGKRILVTRARTQAQGLTQLLQKEGATVFEIPTIDIALLEAGITDLEKALDDISAYQWLILTSINTVNILNDILIRRRQDWSLFQQTRIACIGKSTAQQVQEFGAPVVLIPPLFQAESLAEELLKQDLKGKKILLPRAAGSREVLPRLLNEAGATVTEIHIYWAEVPEASRLQLTQLLESRQIDIITFTSSSTVRNFLELAGDLVPSHREHTSIACIGPITAATLQEYGITPNIVAQEFTMEGLVQAIVANQPALSKHSATFGQTSTEKASF